MSLRLWLIHYPPHVTTRTLQSLSRLYPSPPPSTMPHRPPSISPPNTIPSVSTTALSSLALTYASSPDTGPQQYQLQYIVLLCSGDRIRKYPPPAKPPWKRSLIYQTRIKFSTQIPPPPIIILFLQQKPQSQGPMDFSHTSIVNKIILLPYIHIYLCRNLYRPTI